MPTDEDDDDEEEEEVAQLLVLGLSSKVEARKRRKR